MQYYNSNGMPITHLGFLNEPDYTVSYSQMQISSDAKEAIDFIPILKKAVQAANVNVKVCSQQRFLSSSHRTALT